MIENGQNSSADRLAYLQEKNSLAFQAHEAIQVAFQHLAKELYEAISHKWPDASDYFMMLSQALDALEATDDADIDQLSPEAQKVKAVLDAYKNGAGIEYAFIFDEEDFDEFDPSYLGVTFNVLSLDKFIEEKFMSNYRFEFVIHLDSENPELARVSCDAFGHLELADMRVLVDFMSKWDERTQRWISARIE